VVDMDQTGGQLEVVVGTSAGNVHVIDLEGGPRDRPGFPYSMGTIHGQVYLFTNLWLQKLITINYDSKLFFTFPYSFQKYIILQFALLEFVTEV